MAQQSATVRPPRQRRSRESYERVLEAARRLLEENGFDGFTVSEVAARSGVSVGAIYERFGSKESLLRVVHAGVMESLSAAQTAILAEVAGAEPAEVIAQAVAAIAREPIEHRAILRAFMHLGAVDPEIAERGSQASIALGRAFKAVVLAQRKAIVHPDPDLAVDVGFRMVYCTVARQVMYGPAFESDLAITWDRLLEELSAACVAYLLGVPAARPARGRQRG